MKITFLGHAAFRFLVRTQTDSMSPKESVTVVTDPFQKSIGLSFPSTKADVVLVSHDHDDHNAVDAVKGSPFIIDGSGEYEIKGVGVEGFTAFHDMKNGEERGTVTQYIITVEDLRIVFLADFGQKELSSEQVDKIGVADILILPVGGTYTIGPKEAAAVVSQVEPRVVIPMHFKIKGLKVKLEHTVDDFVKEMGGTAETTDAFSATASNMPQDETKIVVLEAKAKK